VGFAADKDQERKAALSVINNILAFLSTILWLLSTLIGAMIHPNWTDGSILGLSGDDGGILKKMWILVSNIVYFLFALIFVWIAFLTIYKWESYALKDKLPRFIAGVLIVPFSWFIVQFVISISSILTYAILSLPFDTFPQEKLATLWESDIMCSRIEIDSDPNNLNPISPKLKDCQTKVKLKDIIDPKKNEWIFGIMYVYTYGILQIQNMPDITLNDAGSIVKTILSLSTAAIINLLFVVVYTIIIFALFFALFVRWVYMWAYAMFSPVFWILWFLWKEKEWYGDGKFGILPFINLALVPVYVWGALAFWLVFLFTAWQQQPIPWWKTFTNNGVVELWNTTGTGKTIQQWDKTVPIVKTDVNFLIKDKTPTVTMTFIWPQWTIMWATPDEWTLLSELKAYAGIGWILLLRLFGLAILYMTVMLALKSSKVTESIANPFFEFWKSIWSMLAKAPINTPFIPTGLKDEKGNAIKLSASWLASMGSQISWSLDNLWKSWWNTLAKKFDEHFNPWWSLDRLVNQWKNMTDAQKNSLEWEKLHAELIAEARKSDDNMRRFMKTEVWQNMAKEINLSGVSSVLDFDRQIDTHTTETGNYYRKIFSNTSSGISNNEAVARTRAWWQAQSPAWTPPVLSASISVDNPNAPTQYTHDGSTRGIPAVWDISNIVDELKRLHHTKENFDSTAVQAIFDKWYPPTSPWTHQIVADDAIKNAM